MKRPALAIVPAQSVDLYTNWKADIASRDWDAVHIAADKQKPVEISEPRKRGWR